MADPPPRSTPLHSACRSTRFEAVKALLLGGADETLGDLTLSQQQPRLAQIASMTAAELFAVARAMADGPPPSAGAEDGPTPLDVVGLGNLGRDEDPTQRGLSETAEEYSRRRDPGTMEAIRQALRYDMIHEE